MAILYVRSTDGSNADSGATWALAKADVTGAAAIDAAGDTVYLSDNHAESTAAALTLSFAGTAASPTKVISADDAAEPPTAALAGATVTTTGNSSITVNGCVYMWGVTFNCGTGANSVALNLNNTAGFECTYEECTFNLVGTGGSAAIATTPGSANARTIWKNCDVRFYAAAHKINPNRGALAWDGGSLVFGTTSPTVLFGNGGASGRSEILVSGVDLSSGGTSMAIFTGSGGGGRYVMRNCRLPTSWAGSLVSGTLVPGTRAEMHNCDSADTNYRLWVEDFLGTIKSETTLVKTNGANDGATPHAWKIVSGADAEYPAMVLYSPEMSVWNETEDTSVTITVDILHDSATALNDDEVWLELQYLGWPPPLAAWISDGKASPVATAAAQTTSSATWTTTGMSNPNKQKLSVTFTPQSKGYIQARVCVGKASATIYVDPVLQVS